MAVQGAQGTPDLSNLLNGTGANTEAEDPTEAAQLQHDYEIANSDAGYAKQEDEASTTGLDSAEKQLSSYDVTQKGKILNDIKAAEENLASKLRGHGTKRALFEEEFQRYVSQSLDECERAEKNNFMGLAVCLSQLMSLERGYDIQNMSFSPNRPDISISSAPNDYNLKMEEADLKTEGENIENMYTQADRMEESIGEYYRDELAKAKDRQYTAQKDYAQKDKAKENLWAQIQANREKPTV